MVQSKPEACPYVGVSPWRVKGNFIFENRFPAVAPVEQMVNGTFKFNARFASHASSFYPPPPRCQKRNTDSDPFLSSEILAATPFSPARGGDAKIVGPFFTTFSTFASASKTM